MSFVKALMEVLALAGVSLGIDYFFGTHTTFSTIAFVVAFVALERSHREATPLGKQA